MSGATDRRRSGASHQRVWSFAGEQQDLVEKRAKETDKGKASNRRRHGARQNSAAVCRGTSALRYGWGRQGSSAVANRALVALIPASNPVPRSVNLHLLMQPSCSSSYTFHSSLALFVFFGPI